MAKKKIDETVSMGYWMLALIITWLPLLNLVVVPVLAMVSRNPSKKNFYKANIMFVLLTLIIYFVVLIAVLGPDFFTVIRDYIQSRV